MIKKFIILLAIISTNSLVSNPNDKVEYAYLPFVEHQIGNNIKVNIMNNRKEAQKKYEHTEKGLFTKIYSRQRVSSKERNHPLPTYTKRELVKWLLSQKLFYTLFDDWVASNFDNMLTPSCDRTDDYQGYSLDRLKLKTWEGNRDKGYSDRKNGTNNKVSKSVLLFSKEGVLVKEYYSIKHAYRETGINHNNISRYCNGMRKPQDGRIWKFKEAI